MCNSSYVTSHVAVLISAAVAECLNILRLVSMFCALELHEKERFASDSRVNQQKSENQIKQKLHSE